MTGDRVGDVEVDPIADRWPALGASAALVAFVTAGLVHYVLSIRLGAETSSKEITA
ncbi:hypothetical protein ACFVVM_24440 [Nocardia sp. NPDC058176]|uniref:hypothetical protein n=1 Tax=Nocardia sp. NPDC058176 TaxID=3346368 RepID=UPI0036DA3CFA